MAIRKAEYRFRNGSTWDTLYFKTIADQIIDLCPSILISRTTDLVNRPSDGGMQWNKTEDDTTLAQIVSGTPSNIKILKTGLYLICCKHALLISGASSGGVLQMRKVAATETMLEDAIMGMGNVNNESNLNLTTMMRFTAGDIVKFTSFYSATVTTFMTVGSVLRLVKLH
ncbi:hypothetical protein ELI_4670 [Eubacterium callanderi]|uniref:Uncharacterized protein n=1 Tax=Eubacterium callanderi TaxID=53442 RepID=E3GEP5_9FIRM|nr:hypothetical protein [Eubacterium callanderi]OEZ05731.1 hypothetical protein BUME_09680 [[Butyribacterium] methylotrophicum]ADO36302.1 hypothetical protein ELI_1316 [Eubacterium callanderi]ADO38161.1 hypothetical protein ELI_3192 [Eubacterium callanderi]AEU12338.1 hypothetical protein ELI_4670 [Eubacterium callanderi]WPK84108.1 hypothetical protein EUCAMar_16410 [Eubacterium callanderi]